MTAGALTRQPDSTNPLQTNKFRFQILRAPNLQFFCQEAELPGVLLGRANQPSDIDDIPRPGDRLRRGDLRIVFQVDKDLDNYIEVLGWAYKLASPRVPTEYKDLLGNAAKWASRGVVSDLSLLIADSAHVSKIEFVFEDAWPTSISSLLFRTDTEHPDTFQAEATFVFRNYRVYRISDTEALV